MNETRRDFLRIVVVGSGATLVGCSTSSNPATDAGDQVGADAGSDTDSSAAEDAAGSDTDASAAEDAAGSGADSSATADAAGGGTDSSAAADAVAGAGAFFQPNLETASTVRELFDDLNGTPAAELSTEVARPGRTRSIKLTYAADEDGVDLIVGPFPETRSLFARKYEYFAPGWETNWPVGLKTARYFTTTDLTTGDAPNAYAYCSEKLIWQTYEGNRDDLYARGYNNAIFDLDLEGVYAPSVSFGNGLPFLRTGHWYKMETWLVLNSAVDVADGVMQVWIDDQLVCDRKNLTYRSSTRGIPNGAGWRTMWFGGNYSGATFGGPTTTLHRYISDPYLSTSLDR
jgi:hypothetical protein